jgi:hypothetical protein
MTSGEFRDRSSALAEDAAPTRCSAKMVTSGTICSANREILQTTTH